MYYHKVVLFLFGFFLFCSCAITRKENSKLYDFVNNYNVEPEQPHISSARYVRAVEISDPTSYKVNQRAKRGLSGGVMEQNINDPKYTELAKESMQKYLTNNGISQAHSVIRINSVTTQVVAGSLTEISFDVAPDEQANGNTYNCTSKIFEQLWQNVKEIAVSCNAAN